MLETALVRPVGTRVDLVRGDLLARSTIVWTSANRCGVSFESKISVKDWLASVSKPEQRRVDNLVELVKAGGLDPGDTKGNVGGGWTSYELVNDLGRVGTLLQNLEDDLSSSEATLERHGLKLQNLDIAMQMIRAIADVLKQSNDEGPDSVSRLDGLRTACEQALGKS